MNAIYFRHEEGKGKKFCRNLHLTVYNLIDFHLHNIKGEIFFLYPDLKFPSKHTLNLFFDFKERFLFYFKQPKTIEREKSIKKFWKCLSFSEIITWEINYEFFLIYKLHDHLKETYIDSWIKKMVKGRGERIALKKKKIIIENRSCKNISKLSGLLLPFLFKDLSPFLNRMPRKWLCCCCYSNKNDHDFY